MQQKGDYSALENLKGIDPLVKIFTDLIAFDTQADPKSKAVPSSVGQLRFGAYLCSVLREMGFDAHQDEKGVVMAHISASAGYENAPSLCLLAHMDTAPDASGANVRASLVTDYKGFDIVLENGLLLNQKISPKLGAHIGDDIIVTDGKTLLGADDKAGIACILMLLHKIRTQKSFVHGPLCVVFSVDEEIGNSSGYIDVDKVSCRYGLTVDGTALGELDTATFNAYGAVVGFKGLSVHTAVAYKTLVNAISMAAEFISLLPRDEKPENTKDDEGFYHVHNIEGSVQSCSINMIIRDFTKEGMEKRLQTLRTCADFMKKKYGEDSVVLKESFQYANMGDVLSTTPEYIELIRQSYKDAGVEVFENAVRGGTDGSNLSNRGLPTPNIFTGALNCHGPYECLSVQAFNSALNVLTNIVKRMALMEKL